jgi:hypothetical protein
MGEMNEYAIALGVVTLQSIDMALVKILITHPN